MPSARLLAEAWRPDKVGDASFIATETGLGYRLRAEVEVPQAS